MCVCSQYWLEVTNVTLALDGYERVVLTVNGTVPGPTIYADWGDTVGMLSSPAIRWIREADGGECKSPILRTAWPTMGLPSTGTVSARISPTPQMARCPLRSALLQYALHPPVRNTSHKTDVQIARRVCHIYLEGDTVWNDLVSLSFRSPVVGRCLW